MEDGDLAICLARLDERIKALRTEMDVREQLAAKAMVIASEEMHRRLDILNNESGRIKEIQSQTVAAGVYEAERNAMARRLEILERFVWVATGVIALLAFSIGVAVKFLR